MINRSLADSELIITKPEHSVYVCFSQSHFFSEITRAVVNERSYFRIRAMMERILDDF